MITRTALQVITDSLKLIGVVAGHEVPTSAEQQDSFARLAEMIDGWGTHAHTMIRTRRDVVPLVNGQQSYTFSSTGDWDLPRPMTIDGAAVLSGTPPTVEVPIAVLTDQEYVALPLKDQTGALPQAVLYEPDPVGSLWVTPIPTADQDLVIYWREPVQQFPDLVTVVALTPGYAKALRTNLAVELAPEFGRVIDPVVMKLAAERLGDIKRQNVPMVEIGIDPALTNCGPSYSILSDT